MTAAGALFGHDAAQAELRAALSGPRPHHAWLIAGPRGIGKAALARKAALALLAGDWGAGSEHPAARRMEAGSHADWLALQPAYNAEKEEEGKEITVEQARSLGEFFSLTPAEGAFRVGMIDSVDEMNANAANAILKVLEEPPPQAMLLLISHQPGKLLATIRSRCRMLKLAPLSADDFQRVMRAQAPQIADHELQALSVLSRHSPGLALALHAQEGLALYGDLAAAVASGSGIAALSERMAGQGAHARWRAAGELAARLVSRAVESALHPSFQEVASGEAEACRTLRAAMPLQALAQRYAWAQEQFSVAAAAHLDYKTVLTTFLHTVKRPAA